VATAELEAVRTNRAPWTAVLHEWLVTVDHKQIGILYVMMSLVFMILAGAAALLVRLQLWAPHLNILPPTTYNQFFTLHGTTMVFFVGMPILIGIGNFAVPLMIGARDMAFPRMNAFGFWATLFGGLLVYFSFFVPGGPPAVGWFAYAPMSENAFSRGPGVDCWALGLIISGLGTTTAAINFIATIVCLRCPGMKLRLVPFFVWVMLWTSIQILLAIPPLTAALVMLEFDRKLGAHFFEPQYGGSAIMWQHMFWFFGHPEVYILVLPAFGMISEVVPVFSRKVLFGYEFMAAATAAIVLISLGVWAHHMFSVGMSRVLDLFFVGMTMLISIPTGIKMFNWLATMYGGKLVLKSPMLFAIGFLSMFVIGGLTGIILACAPINFQVHNSYFVVGHFHWVLIGGTLFGVFAAIHYWYPKATGRMLSERLAKWQFWLLYLGFILTFAPMHVSGVLGMPRRIYTYEPNRGWDLWNQLATLGAILQAPSYLIFAWNIIASLWNGKPAGDDPWDAWTLEWATTSPPPSYNFDTVPTVRSRRPLWDLKHPDDPDWKYE
jgi:cytochrome c oxidase subunit 1